LQERIGDGGKRLVVRAVEKLTAFLEFDSLQKKGADQKIV
jgi:hypothetical protein